MSEQDAHASDGEVSGADARDGSGGSVTTSARRMAAIPSLRPERRRLGRQAMTLGFGATAVAVALIVVAVTLFGSRGHLAPSRTAHASATQTTGAQRATSSVSLNSVAAISMDASNDGWALGDATSPSATSSQDSVAALYHYDGSQWRLAQLVKGFSIYTGYAPATIKMLSPTDGWVFSDTDSFVLHYDGTSWRQVKITLDGGAIAPIVLALDMVSPTEGWAAVQGAGNTPQGAVSFLRYDGQQWTRDAGVISLPGSNGPPPVITGISALLGGDVWAVGYIIAPPPQGTGTDANVGLIFHRIGGVWQLVSKLNAPTTSVDNVVPSGILMLSPTIGWIIGESDQYQTNSNGTFVNSHALLLHYDFSKTGTRWVPVTPPIEFPTVGDHLNQVIAAGPNDVWVSGSTTSENIVSGVSVNGLLLHYDGAHWTQLTPTLLLTSSGSTGFTRVGLNTIALTPDGVLWAAGGIAKSDQNGMGSPFFCHDVGGQLVIDTPTLSMP